MAMELGVQYMNILNIKDKSELEPYDTLIIGTPIYNDDIYDDMRYFINTFKEEITGKSLILYTVHGAVKGFLDTNYTNKFAKYFINEPILLFGLWGRATISMLSEKDLKMLKNFYRFRLGAEFEDFDHTYLNNLEKVARTIKQVL